jgi:hypothetical protein
VLTVLVAGCGGVAVHPESGASIETLQASGANALPAPPTAPSSGGTSAGSPGASPGGVLSALGATPIPSEASPMTSGAQSDQQAITGVLQTFTYLLSGLDDNLNSAWLPPLAAVTTERMAQASTRQASAILNAHEHGVGRLIGRNVTVKMTGATSAAVAECENYADFYLVDDGTNSPDPGIVRGNFVGTAQLSKVAGRWYVDVYATTRTACDWAGAR